MRPSVFISGATCAILLAQNARAQTLAPPLPDADLLKLGKHYTEWFFTGQTDSLLAHMVPETRTATGGADGILQARDQIAARAGNETLVLEEKMTRRRGKPQFWHAGTFDGLSEPLVIRWVMNDDGQIVGVGLGPKSSTPAPDSVGVAPAATPAGR